MCYVLLSVSCTFLSGCQDFVVTARREKTLQRSPLLLSLAAWEQPEIPKEIEPCFLHLSSSSSYPPPVQMQPNNLSRNMSPRWCLTIPGSLLASFRVYEAFMPAHRSVTSAPAVAPSSMILPPPPVTWEGSWTCPEMKCRQAGWVYLHVMKHTRLWIVLYRNTTPQQ